MLQRFTARAVTLLDRLIGGLVGIPALRRVAYASRNRQAFTRMFEHEKMLADRVRVDTYAKATEKHIRPGDVVIDVGTGTGILSFLAARSNPEVVHAIDHSETITMAEALARANGISGIEFHKTHSRDFRLPARADVILHEQIGDLLLEERMVETLIDLRDRVLKPGGKIVPGRFSLSIDPVQLHDEDAVPFAWENVLHGVDFGPLRPMMAESGRRYRIRYLYPDQFSHPLAESKPLLELDLNTAVDASLPTRLRAAFPIVRAGRLDGFCVSFVAHFDDELRFGSSPFGPRTDRPPNWVSPLLRHEAVQLAVGDDLVLELEATDLADPATWRWHTNRQSGRR